MQLLPALGEGDFASVDALNRRLWTWVEGEYHQRPHKGLDGTTPVDAWAMRSSEVRMPGPEHDLVELFLFEEMRQVNKDRTVSLRGIRYEVDAALVGGTVTLGFDPNRPGASVDLWHKGAKVHTARVVDAYSNCFAKRRHGGPLATAKTSFPGEPPSPGVAYEGSGASAKGWDVMYIKHFGLERRPFGKDIPSDELFTSAGTLEYQTRLAHLVDMGGIGVFTGDAGCGKSTATRAAMGRLHSGLYKVFYVPLSTGNPMDLHKSIA